MADGNTQSAPPPATDPQQSLTGSPSVAAVMSALAANPQTAQSAQPAAGPMGLPTGGGILGRLFQGPQQLPPQAVQAILSGISTPPAAQSTDPMQAATMSMMGQGQQELGTQYEMQHALQDKFNNAMARIGTQKLQWEPKMEDIHDPTTGKISGKSILHDIGTALALAGLSTRWGQNVENARFAGARMQQHQLAEQANMALEGMKAQAPILGAAGAETYRPGMTQARMMSATGQLMKDQTYAQVQPALEQLKAQMQPLQIRLQHGDKQAMIEAQKMMEAARDMTMQRVAGTYANATERGQEVGYAQDWWNETLNHWWQSFTGTAPEMPAIPPRSPGAAPPAAPGAGTPAKPAAGGGAKSTTGTVRHLGKL